MSCHVTSMSCQINVMSNQCHVTSMSCHITCHVTCHIDGRPLYENDRKLKLWAEMQKVASAASAAGVAKSILVSWDLFFGACHFCSLKTVDLASV